MTSSAVVEVAVRVRTVIIVAVVARASTTVVAAASRTFKAVAVVAAVAITRDACGAVAASAIVAAIPSIAHAAMLVAHSVAWTEVVAMALIVASTAIPVPAVAATIAHVEVGTSEVEIVAPRIVGIDAEVPEASVPVQRTVEIGGCTIEVPLPRIENVAEVKVATLPVGAEDVVTASDTHQIVEVDLVGCLVLCIGEVQLVCHLVGQEQCLLASLLVAHGVCACCYRQHGNQGKHHLLHSRMLFKLLIIGLVLISDAKEAIISETYKGFSLNTRGKNPICAFFSFLLVDSNVFHYLCSKKTE